MLDLLGKCIGEEAKYEGIKLLFDGLQQPVLNKQVSYDSNKLLTCKIHCNNYFTFFRISLQLTYILLDLVILELFPELNKVSCTVCILMSTKEHTQEQLCYCFYIYAIILGTERNFCNGLMDVEKSTTR